MEIVARKGCNEILEKEKKKAETESQNQGEKDGLVGIAVSYDMGWQKRGKGHNSLTGHGTAMGLVTGKVLSYATRCKSCRVCDSSKRSGKAAKNHDYRKNHAGSSKSMERDVACELWRSAPKAGVKSSTHVGDDDSTTMYIFFHFELRAARWHSRLDSRACSLGWGRPGSGSTIRRFIWLLKVQIMVE